MRVEDTLIPARFLATMGHFIAVCMLFYSMDENIKAGLPSSASQDQITAKESEVKAALGLSLICFFIEFAGLFGGLTIFMHQNNVFYIICHFIGCILMSWLIIESWHYTTVWYITAFFSFLPATFEVIAIARIRCCKVVSY